MTTAFNLVSFLRSFSLISTNESVLVLKSTMSLLPRICSVFPSVTVAALNLLNGLSLFDIFVVTRREMQGWRLTSRSTDLKADTWTTMDKAVARSMPTGVANDPELVCLIDRLIEEFKDLIVLKVCRCF